MQMTRNYRTMKISRGHEYETHAFYTASSVPPPGKLSQTNREASYLHSLQTDISRSQAELFYAKTYTISFVHFFTRTKTHSQPGRVAQPF